MTHTMNMTYRSKKQVTRMMARCSQGVAKVYPRCSQGVAKIKRLPYTWVVLEYYLGRVWVE